MSIDLLATSHLVRQHGLITRAQALDLGYSRHQITARLRSGVWIPVDRSVYRHHAYPETFHNRLLAVCLGTNGVASHRAAGALWALDGCRSDRLEITVPAGCWVRRAHVRIHETTQWATIGATSRDGIPVTGVDRTLLDLAAVVSRRRLRQAVEDAMRRRLTDWPRLTGSLVLHARRGRNGTAPFRDLIASYRSAEPIARSEWSNVVAELLVDAGLPRPVPEHRVTDGSFRADLDLAYPIERVGIELDSVSWHFNLESFHGDPVRRNHLTVLGWRVLTFTWQEFVENPSRLVDNVRTALAA